jgi:hypothetical protein
MFDTYAPDLFPANEKGQIHFARAMMEGTADEIRAYTAAVAGWLTAFRGAVEDLARRVGLMADAPEWVGAELRAILDNPRFGGGA